MTLTNNFDQTLVRQFRQKLDNDPFINLLGGLTLFKNIPPMSLPLPLLEELSEMVEVVPLRKKRQLVFPQPAPVYEIISGYVKIYDNVRQQTTKGKKALGTQPALLAWRVPGELLGDFNFVYPEGNISDKIIATDECQLLKVPSDTLRKLAQSYPQIYLNIAGNLASKAAKNRVRAQLLRLPHIKCMIAKIFVELLAERGYDKSADNGIESRVINGTFHVSDIATFLGYKYHRTQTGVRALIKTGLLAHYQQNKKSGRFVICDEDRLRRYLETGEMDAGSGAVNK